MKKLLILILALVMVLSLKLPSDMPVSESNKTAFVNVETGENAVAQLIEAGEKLLSETTQKEFIESELSDSKDVVIKSFDNKKQINGKDALVCEFTYTSPKGSAITTIIFVANGSKECVVALSYGCDKVDGSLAKNQQDIIDSITVKVAL
ncbi:MAG TPA: hypothetical protein PK200_01490 [Spirochaetota bacterium]|nr:hypothetical protein [Spirochaetota bacterium]